MRLINLLNRPNGASAEITTNIDEIKTIATGIGTVAPVNAIGGFISIEYPFWRGDFELWATFSSNPTADNSEWFIVKKAASSDSPHED